jgi:hypothetical protein
MFPKSVVEPRPIPRHWLRVAGFDKGWRDETAMLIGAIDPLTGVVYIYEEYYVSKQPMSFHADEIKKLVKPYKWYANIQADPTVNNKNERDGVSYATYFYKLSGISLEEANNNIDIGIERVRDYMYTGKIKFFSSLVYLKKEMISYCYKEDGSAVTGKEKPIDKMNHLCDALRYLTTKLPLDTEDLLSYNTGNVYRPDGKKETNTNIFMYDDKDFRVDDSNIFIGGDYYE